MTDASPHSNPSPVEGEPTDDGTFMEDWNDLEDDHFDELEPEDLPGIRKALKVYRVMAWIVGVLLVTLTLIAMPIKYIWDNGIPVMINGITHGWLYGVLLITVFALGMRVKWPWQWYLGIALAGTVPFLSFYAERRATKYVEGRIKEVEEKYPETATGATEA